MKNETLYKKTCDILYAAYFNDTLQHGNPCACAVGNLISANMGLETEIDGCGEIKWKNKHDYWCDLIFTLILLADWKRKEGQEEIKSTGYSLEQIIRIESAFESATELSGFNAEERMFNGLANVINVLNEIHEVEQDTQTERFRKHYKTKTKQLV